MSLLRYPRIAILAVLDQAVYRYNLWRIRRAMRRVSRNN